MAFPVHIAGTGQFKQLLSSTTVVVTDFYADWCGPCKTIAPEFERMSKQFSAPKVVAFAKVNVDQQQGIAQTYGVRAMPTFIIFKNGSAVETIKGADPRALAAAIEKACRGAKAAKAAYTYSSQGHTLGGGPARGGASLGRPLDIKGYFDAVVAFLGLYVYSLFALDAYSSAEKSPFNVNGVAWEKTKVPGAKPAVPQGKKVGTINDFKSS